VVESSECEYRCPGEKHPISRAVHLSRLASFYPACRECELREEVGVFSHRIQSQFARRNHATSGGEPEYSDGIRGRYLNDIRTRDAGRFAAAFASLLWRSRRLPGRTHRRQQLPPVEGPLIVSGFDDRPQSPGVTAAVAGALRRMACRVAESGPSTGPELEATVDQLHADGGILVTGSGCDSAWTGLDFFVAGGKPVSRGIRSRTTAGDAFSIDDIVQCAASTIDLPVRRAGFAVGYDSPDGASGHVGHPGLPPAIPNSICIAVSNRHIHRAIQDLAWPGICDVRVVRLPTRARNLADPEDADVNRLVNAVLETDADVGILLDDDRRRIAVVNEDGVLLHPSHVLVQLLQQPTGCSRVSPKEFPSTGNATTRQRKILFQDRVAAAGPPGAAGLPVAAQAVIPEEWGPVESDRIRATGASVIRAPSTLAHFHDALRASRAGQVIGCDAFGRFWFYYDRPYCDALISLSMIPAVLPRRVESAGSL